MSEQDRNSKASLWRSFTGERLMNLLVSGLAFGIIGIIFNLAQCSQSSVQNSKIHDILAAISTQYIAQFPDDLDNAKDLIANASKGDELRILVDFPGYGHYSCPGKYRDYLSSIKMAAAKGAHIQMLVYGKQAAEGDLKSQFSDDDFKKIFPSGKWYKGEFQNNCMTDDDEYKGARYLDSYKDELKACGLQHRPSNNAEFVNMLLCTNNRLCKKLRGYDIEIRTINIDFQKIEKVFIWMRIGEERKLIINYPDFLHVGKGSSFRTTDDRLLNIFLARFKQAWDANKPEPARAQDEEIPPCYPETNSRQAAIH